MSSIKRKLYTMTHTPRIFMKKFSSTKFFKCLPDKLALKIMYKNTFLKKLNLKNPKTFNEKLQWLKLYNRKPEYTKMVDKYTAKEYVASILGEEYIIPTYGVWERFDDIDFEKLPNQFVLKCTHGSGDVIVCKDKSQLDIASAKAKMERSLKTNYYKLSREWPYKNVKPRIIAEKYMEDASKLDIAKKEGESLNDYKLMCFNGKMRCSFVCSGRFSKEGLHVTFFDRDWNVMPFERSYPNVKDGLPRPNNYEKMVELSERLSKNIPFVRVDFYEINGQIYFGELTLFPGGGFEKFSPSEWDEKIGDMLILPEKHNK